MHKLQNKAGDKLDAKWQLGVWVGKTDESDEHILLTPTGVQKARSVHRKPEAEKWDSVFFGQAKGSPWNPAAVAAREVLSAGPMMIQRERRMYITKAMILEHGITKGCDSCLGIGTKHSGKCRARFEEMYGFTMPTEAPREKDKKEKVQEQTAPATDGIEKEVPGGDDDDVNMQGPENEKAAISSTSPPTTIIPPTGTMSTTMATSPSTLTPATTGPRKFDEQIASQEESPSKRIKTGTR